MWSFNRVELTRETEEAVEGGASRYPLATPLREPEMAM
jgi:hypothetical protein